LAEKDRQEVWTRFSRKEQNKKKSKAALICNSFFTFDCWPWIFFIVFEWGGFCYQNWGLIFNNKFPFFSCSATCRKFFGILTENQKNKRKVSWSQKTKLFKKRGKSEPLRFEALFKLFISIDEFFTSIKV